MKAEKVVDEIYKISKKVDQLEKKVSLIENNLRIIHNLIIKNGSKHEVKTGKPSAEVISPKGSPVNKKRK